MNVKRMWCQRALQCFVGVSQMWLAFVYILWSRCTLIRHEAVFKRLIYIHSQTYLYCTCIQGTLERVLRTEGLVTSLGGDQSVPHTLLYPGSLKSWTSYHRPLCDLELAIRGYCVTWLPHSFLLVMSHRPWRSYLLWFTLGYIYTLVIFQNTNIYKLLQKSTTSTNVYKHAYRYMFMNGELFCSPFVD